MRPAHPLPITATALQPSAPVRISFAAEGCLPKFRNGSGRDGGGVPRPLRLIQFRSVALAGAGLIDGVGLAGPCDAVRARVERVFASMKEVVLSLIHDRQIGMESVGDVREVVGEFRRV